MRGLPVVGCDSWVAGADRHVAVLVVPLSRLGVGGGWARCWGIGRCWYWSWDRPSVGGAAHPEHGHPGDVDRAGEEPEVGVDPFGAADPGSSAAVFATHQVPELAFHLGAGRAVVGDPRGVGLPGAGVGQGLFVRADADRAPLLRRWCTAPAAGIRRSPARSRRCRCRRRCGRTGTVR